MSLIFEKLPEEYLFYLALSLPFPSLSTLCITDSHFNQLIYKNEYFWHQKFLKDHGPLNYLGSWKYLYLTFSNIYVSGDNHFGELGLDDCISIDHPTQLHGFKAKQVSCGAIHSAVIDINNYLWTFGYNQFGRLGIGNSVNQMNVPVLVTDIKVKSVSAGNQNTMFIDFDNNVWGFGANSHGELGLGDFTTRYYPDQIPQLKAKQVSSGGLHTLVIDLNDNVWAFGLDDAGRLGINTSNHINVPVPTLIPGINAKEVAAGYAHSLIIDLNDNVWSFGFNGFGQLGLGSDLRAMIWKIELFQPRF